MIFLSTQRVESESIVSSSGGQGGIASNCTVVSASNGLVFSIDEQVLVDVTARNTSADGGNDVSPKGTPMAEHKSGCDGAGRVQRSASEGAAGEGSDNEAKAKSDGGSSLKL